jgi:hypothetical protein
MIRSLSHSQQASRYGLMPWLINTCVSYSTIYRKMWEAAVLQPLEARRPEGRARLMSLLKTHMIR